MVKKYFLFLLISLLLFSYFILSGITLPYVGPNATNFSVYSLIAHNFNIFGYLPTKFSPVISVSPTLPQHPEYFFHHPTFLSFVESLLFKLFGEGFWVGRLTVILFAFGSLFLTFLIGKQIANKQFASTAVFLMAIIPASTLFGKMIGQESLVLFFCLFMLYAALNFLRRNQKRYLILMLIAIVLGIWSDWPATFFPFFLFPLFQQQKKIKTWAALLVFSAITVGSLFFYIYVMKSGFDDLHNAIALRSVTGLLSIPLWPLRWLGTTFFRLLMYFNPLILLLAFWYGIRLYKKKLWESQDTVIISLLSFAVFYICFYAQATFTHPYLVYYFLPFIVFASASQITKLFKEKRIIILTGIMLFSLLYLFVIQNYKSKQIEDNAWRYDFTKKVSEYLSPYEYILTNTGPAIDSDMMWYPFLITMKEQNNDLSNALQTHKHYVFSCTYHCISSDPILMMLIKNYHYVLISNTHAEAYVFSLQQKRELNNTTPDKKIIVQTRYNEKTNGESMNTIRNFYRYMVTFLHVPQL